MFISKITSNTFTAKKLVPITQYKGPILKLTAKDNEKIAELLNLRFYFETELEAITKRLSKNTKTITSEWHRLSCREQYLRSHIDSIDKTIRQIKINRLNQQKTKSK
ncbi:MAG: hypothetical protein E7Z92_08080 [Cyanobacteria bacterium SIG31]|nr:hypothetical protein [Cyanobacteria bacterium SIG31]